MNGLYMLLELKTEFFFVFNLMLKDIVFSKESGAHCVAYTLI